MLAQAKETDLAYCTDLLHPHGKALQVYNAEVLHNGSIKHEIYNERHSKIDKKRGITIKVILLVLNFASIDNASNK